MKYGNSDLQPNETLENILIEFELMNPIESYTTFNAFINHSDQIPSRSKNLNKGFNWGSGSGMGMFFFSKKS